MRRRTLRTCLSLMLIAALSAMVPMRATVAMPAMAGMAHMAPMAAHAVHGVHHAIHAMTDKGGGLHPGHPPGCHCGTHCGLCGACFTALSASPDAGISLLGATPGLPATWRPTAVYLSPDPYPPRA